MSLKDDLIKHQIFIQRLGVSHAKSITATINKAIKLAIRTLKKEDLTPQRTRVLHTKLIEILHTIPVTQTELLLGAAEYEARFIAKTLKKNFNKDFTLPDQDDLKKAVEKTKMSVVSGETKYTVSKVYTKFANTKASEILLVVSDTDLEKEEKVQKGTDKLLMLAAGLFAVQALTLATTSTTQAASVARDVVYKENNIPLVDWVTELDSDVCEDCSALGNNGPYPVTDTEIPPEHWNCRCVLVPVEALQDE